MLVRGSGNWKELSTTLEAQPRSCMNSAGVYNLTSSVNTSKRACHSLTTSFPQPLQHKRKRCQHKPPAISWEAQRAAQPHACVPAATAPAVGLHTSPRAPPAVLLSCRAAVKASPRDAADRAASPSECLSFQYTGWTRKEGGKTHCFQKHLYNVIDKLQVLQV